MRKLLATIADARGGALGMLQTMLAQVGILAVNLATGILTARLLGPTGRGEFAAAMLWFMLPSTLAIAGLQSGVVYQTRQDQAKAGSIAIAGLLAAIAIYVPVAATCLIVMPALMHGYDTEVITLARLATASSILNVVMLLARQSLLGTRNMHFFNISSAASPITYLVFLVAVLPFHNLTATSAVLAQVAATAVVIVPTVWWAARDWAMRQVWPMAVLKPLLRYGWRAAGIDLAGVFYSNVDRLVLVGLIAPAQFGLYAVATSFARMIYIVQAAVSSVTLADLAHRPVDEVQAYIHRAFRLLFWLLLAGCVAGWLLGGVLLRLIYGEGFAMAVPTYRIMLAESALSCISQVLIEAYLATGRPSYPAIVQGLYSVTLLAAMLLLAPTWGGVGAAAAMLGAVICKLFFLVAGLRQIGLSTPGLLLHRDDLDVVRKLLGRPPSAPAIP